jgi:hypothetical protein
MSAGARLLAQEVPPQRIALVRSHALQAVAVPSDLPNGSVKDRKGRAEPQPSTRAGAQ